MGKEIVENISKKIGFTPDIMKTIGEIDPSFLRMYQKCDEGVLKDGALSVKAKTLMALAAVAAQRCEPCVESQMRNAINNGATKEEIIETLEVVFMTSGAPGVAMFRNALKQLPKD